MRSRFGRLLEVAIIAVVAVPILYVLLLMRPQAAPTPEPNGVGDTVTQGETPPPDASLEPVLPAAGECFNYLMTFDRPAATIASQTQFSKAVIVGDVVNVSDAKWVGGKEPAHDDKTGASVYRDVTVATKQVAKGKIASGTATFRIPGGTVGCDTYMVEGFPTEVSKGDSFAFFVESNGKANAAISDLTAFEAWPVDASGVVDTPFDGKVPVSDFVADIKSVAP